MIVSALAIFFQSPPNPAPEENVHSPQSDQQFLKDLLQVPKDMWNSQQNTKLFDVMVAKKKLHFNFEPF